MAADTHDEKAHPSQRVGVFIDVQNVYHSAKNLFNSRVNFKELLKNVIADRHLIRAMAYVVKSETALGEESFFEALRKTGLELRLKDLLIFSGGAKKADWDVVLVTGDGDFVPLVEYLKWGLGKQVEVAAFSRTTSSRLREVADSFTELENIPRILLKIRQRGERQS